MARFSIKRLFIPILAFALCTTPVLAAELPAPLVYVRNNALWLLRPGDAEPRAISANGWTSPSSPVFLDAAGRKVLFAAYRLERYGADRRGINLEVADLFLHEDTGVSMVTESNDLAIAPDASRDGRDIYFTSNRHARLRGLFPRSNSMEIFALKRPWRLPERITSDGGSKFNPRISPDNRRLTYLWIRSDGPQGVYVLTLGEDVPRFLAAGGDYPSWRPDGQAIVFAARGRLFEVNADGDTTARPLLPSAFRGFASFPRQTNHGIVFQWSDESSEGIALLKNSGEIVPLVEGETRYGGADLATVNRR